MKLIGRVRQPFVGLALAAAAGIAAADFLQLSQSSVVAGTAAAAGCGILLLWRPNVLFVYSFVFCSFLLLHQLRTTATPGLAFASRLGERPRMITVNGAVVSEPKAALNGKTSFLLHLSSMELEGRTEPSDATILVRGRSSP